CTDVCPANLTGKMLSPMHIVQGMRYHIADATSAESEAEIPSVIGSRIEKEAVWDCLTCGACTEVCPVGNEPFHPLIDIRRYMVMEEPDIPEGAQGALLNLEQRGHPWSGTTFTRESWYEGLDVQTFSENPEAEYLLWVGCTNALEQRSQSIPRAMVGILNRAEVNFAILGPEETCTGDPARRMGNEYLYQMLAMQNIETFNRYGIKKILTSCPHCFNNIKNEYPHLGGSFEVLHYSELISDLIQQEIIKPIVEIDTKLAYHDSCYLGRQNGIYDAPRNVAKSIPGLELIEMEKCRGNGFCCGAGGGHMWFEEGGSERVNHARTDQFLETNADTVGVSCPFCMQMMEEGVQSKGVSDSRKVKDLVELLEESLG
ncbi:MAG: (Fe-S)-binding protein, partial [Chloroflexota bacterium]|nr:(Fe-S)-binding protein [Chloroflexota bacterium]